MEKLLQLLCMRVMTILWFTSNSGEEGSLQWDGATAEGSWVSLTPAPKW